MQVPPGFLDAVMLEPAHQPFDTGRINTVTGNPPLAVRERVVPLDRAQHVEDVELGWSRANDAP
jgi:hypothetical protein